MLFHVYGSNAASQWIAMIAVLVALILLNEFSRRSKFGGLFMFGVLPAALTVYFVVIAVSAGRGGVGASEPDLPVYERVVPLCEALCFPGRLYRFYADKVWMGYR